MKGRAGSAVVLDVPTGKLLAAYHPDVAAKRLALPGSSIKPFTLVALLEAGKVNSEASVMCKRPLIVGSHQLTCSHPDVKQPIDPVTAIAYSCNTWFTTMATRLTPNELRNSFLHDGFGSPTGLLADEASGSVLLAASSEELQLQAIGESGVHITPLELLLAYQKLAQMQSAHDSKLDTVFNGLEASVSYGMGHQAQPGSKLKVAGKTGTARAEEGTWRHAWFAGYAPADHPEIVLVVFLERGTGPVDAAGVARQIFGAYSALRKQRTAD